MPTDYDETVSTLTQGQLDKFKRPEKEIIYSPVEQSPFVFQEEKHIITRLQQGQVYVNVNLPKQIKPMTPIKPKEVVSYTPEKKLASEYISKTLHPYIEIEKIKKPKTYVENVSSVKKTDELVTLQAPENKLKICDSKSAQLDQIFIETKIPKDLRKQEAIESISKKIEPLVKHEHHMSQILQGNVITKVKLPKTATKIEKQKVYPKDEEVIYTATTSLDSPLITQSVEKIKQTQVYTTIVQSGQVITKTKLPELIKLQASVPVYPKEEISFTDSKRIAVEFISKSIKPFIENEKLEKQEVLLQQGQVHVTVHLPEQIKSAKYNHIKPIEEKISFTEEKKLKSEYLSKTLHPYIEIEKIDKTQTYEDLTSKIKIEEIKGNYLKQFNK